MVGWGGPFDYSVKPGPDLSRFRLGLVRLVTRSAKARLSLAKLVTRLERSRTRLVKARARSLTTTSDIERPKNPTTYRDGICSIED